MIKVTITDSSGREREIEIGSKPQVLGRGEDSDIVLGSRSVSRHHMRLWEENDKLMVEDLTGGQGITVDGEDVSGVFELESGTDLEAGVFTFCIPRSRADAVRDKAVAFEEEAPIPLLVGTRGSSKGVEIELREGDNDIGRDPALYLVIDDQSISRQHARLTVGGGLFKLIDMRSSNGTFVNNRRVDTAELCSGDKVRFGNVEFRFLYGKGMSADAVAQRRKKKLMLFGAGGLGLLLLIGISVKLCGKEPPPAVPKDPVDRGPSEEVLLEQRMTAAKAAMKEGDWDAAIVELDEAIDIKPICSECRKLKNTAEDEIANKQQFEECGVDYELNRWRKALSCYLRLPKESFYTNKAKYKISECKKRLITYHMGEGKGYYSARDYRKAHEHFVAVMQLDPCNQEVYQRWVKKSEKALRSRYILKGWTPYNWICEKERPTAGLLLDPEEELRKRYPSDRFHKAMMYYFGGKAQLAIEELQRIIALEKKRDKIELARELIGTLRVAKGRYTDGTSRLRRGKLKEAREQFDRALKADAKLVPEGVTSHYREDIGKQLSLHLHKAALAKYGRDYFEDAFALWKECLELSADSKECAQGMRMLDDVGEQALTYFRDELRKGNRKNAITALKRILNFTTDQSISHQKAQIELNKLE